MEKLAELMQLQLQQQREEMQAQERRFRKQTGRHESHASTPCESFFVGPGRTTYNTFGDGYYFCVL